MRGPSFVATVAGVLALVGCARGGETSPGFIDADGSSGGIDGGGGDATPVADHDASNVDAHGGSADGAADGTTAPDGGGGADGGTADSASGDTGSTPESGADSGLDPLLVLPDPSGAPCADPGQTQCAGAAICRISSTTGGTCESCTGCGNLHAPCTADVDCDTLFQCYAGYCDSLCQLATPQTCGVPTDCINVGNATTGVCKYP
jgi:hypothetical protein